MNEETCWRLPLRSFRAASRARERSRIASCRSSGTQTAVRSPARDSLARAFDGKVESMMVDSQDAANQIQHPDWDKGASHEWGSPIPTICANVSLRQSRPVIPVRKLLSCSTWL